MSLRLPCILAAAIAVLAPLVSSAEEQPAVDFLKHVKPILAQRCFRCHSSLEQESNLRLDSVPAILKGGDGGTIVAPGKSGESRLIAAVQRIGDLKMPPEGEPLTEAQIAVLRAWVDAGAPAPPEGAESNVEHWSFTKSVRPEVPKPADAAWAANPIDALIAAKHAELKLTPVSEAPKNLLLRRVYLDLIGLPPTPEELDAFLKDESPDAYEKVVQRLLDSPHYGERWGRHWMDVWRYSDWDGYGNEIRESKPHIWRWRDWIVESLNADKPYDRMVQEMLAADELAPDDPDALRATGYLVRCWYKFNRNKWLDDAIEHTGKAFLGVTFNCCRCHDHMYDPLQQKEYYALRAIFEPYDIRTDRIPGQADPEKDGVVRVFDAKADAQTFVFVRGNEKDPLKDQPLTAGVPKLFAGVPFAVEPVTLSPAAYYQGLSPFVREEAIASARAAVEKAKSDLESSQKAVLAARQQLADFIATKSNPSAEKKDEPKPAEHFLADDFAKANDQLWKLGAGAWEYNDGHLVQSDPRDEPCGITTMKPHPQDFVTAFRFKTTGGDVYKSVGLAFDSQGQTDFQSVYLSGHSPGPHLWLRKAGADSYPVTAPKNTAVTLGQEYELKLAVRGKLANVWVNGTLVLAYPLPAERASDGRLIFWTYDATAEFLRVTVDALTPDFKLVEKLDGTSAGAPTEESQTAALSDAEQGLRIAESTVSMTNAALTSVQAKIAADAANYASPPAENAKELSLAAGAEERQHNLAAAQVAALHAELKLAQAKRALKPGDMASEKAVKDAEMAAAAAKTALEAAQKAAAEPTENYTRLTTVNPATSTGRRLALARWITSRENPLAARVAVNHMWLRHFGSPLVPSVFDFGINGKKPTNQQLLDWLAVELMESGWQMKRVHKLMVMSRTYRLSSGFRVQGSEGTASNLNPEPRTLNPTIDPENLFYWRANSRRMEAEIVRDATLYVAGSLDPKLGGPDLDQSSGMTVPRRSLYFRASKEKKMEFLALFDSPNPVECYRRSESIAPQQALAMANSPLTLAQSRVLAKNLSDGLGDVAAEEAPKRFIEAAFVRILCRPPTGDELQTCLEFLTEQSVKLADAKSLTAFSAGPAAAIPPSADPQQRARENLVHVLFNHNDFVTVR